MSNGCDQSDKNQAAASLVSGSMKLSTRPGESGDLNAFCGWVKRQLGHPKVRIDLTSAQIYDSLQEALIKYYSVAEQPKRYWQFCTTCNQTLYDLPDDFSTMGPEWFYNPNTVINYLQVFTAYNVYWSFTGGLDTTRFLTTMQALTNKLNIIGARPTYEIVYDRSRPRMKLYPPPGRDTAPVVFSYYPIIDFTTWQPQLDTQGWDWIRRYALARAKDIQGRIRSRYGDSVTSGDQSFQNDGNLLLQEAKTEMKELQDELEGFRTPMFIDLF